MMSNSRERENILVNKSVEPTWVYYSISINEGESQLPQGRDSFPFHQGTKKKSTVLSRPPILLKLLFMSPEILYPPHVTSL